MLLMKLLAKHNPASGYTKTLAEPRVYDVSTMNRLVQRVRASISRDK
jgi:hypothetical protein